MCCALIMMCGILASCSMGDTGLDIDIPIPDIFDSGAVDKRVDELIAAGEEFIIPLKAEAPGTKVNKNGSGVIDYSNASDGYIMACFTKETDKDLRVMVKGPEKSYTYIIKQGEWNVFPLSDGAGSYSATLYENVSADKYAAALTASFRVSLSDDKAPYLRPNQYVNYANAPRSVTTAKVLCEDAEDSLEKVAAVYSFVVKRLKYDYDKASTVQSGYLPVLDEVLEARKGICFDYASLMTGMLRSQGVPCKLVTGYAGEVYHAWISVWVDSEGWIEKVIFFDGKSWQMMDPTYASNRGTRSVSKLIGDGETYQEMFFY